MSVSLVSFNPLRHARFSLRHAIVTFDVSVIVVPPLFHKLQFTYLYVSCTMVDSQTKKKDLSLSKNRGLKSNQQSVFLAGTNIQT